MKHRITWTIEPDEDVQSLVNKRMTELVGRKGNRRGLRTKIINEILREKFSYLLGKREQSQLIKPA